MEPAGLHDGEKIILNSDCCLSGLLPQYIETGIMTISFSTSRISSKLKVFCLWNFCSETMYFGVLSETNCFSFELGKESKGDVIFCFLQTLLSAIRSINDSDDIA